MTTWVKSYRETSHKNALREKCPNKEFFLVCILLYSDWMLEFTPNRGKYDQKKFGQFSHGDENLKIRKTFFTYQDSRFNWKPEHIKTVHTMDFDKLMDIVPF